MNFSLQGAAYTLRASRAFEWETLAGVYEEMEETKTAIVAENHPQSKIAGSVYAVANGGTLGTWQWGDVVFTLYTQNDVSAEDFSALCNTLAGDTAGNETAE